MSTTDILGWLCFALIVYSGVCTSHILARNATERRIRREVRAALAQVHHELDGRTRLGKP